MSEQEQNAQNGRLRSRTAICLTGGGVTGGLYQLGALSALESVVEAKPFDVLIGTSSGVVAVLLHRTRARLRKELALLSGGEA